MRRQVSPLKFASSALVIVAGLGLGFAAARLWNQSASFPVPQPRGSQTSYAFTPPAQAAQKAGPDPAPSVRNTGKRALLVGVTTYDNVPKAHLDGPSNDVRLMRRFLEERYQFPASAIVSLTDDDGAAAQRPTRANIEREFRRLAVEAREGDQIVILLAGHGSRQPESNPPNPQSPEPDGIDEIFLPADVSQWKGFPERVPNAIVDDEIGAWLRAITEKRAYVWAIFDCCHSGTMTRGSEVVRELPPETLVPREELNKARQRAAQRQGTTRGGSDPKPAPFVPRQPSEYLVALYACRSKESTPEGLQPSGSPNAETHGLLTYSLVDVLTKSADSNSSLTYRELVRRVQARYAGRIQGAPTTPLVEGRGQVRLVLGTAEPSPSPFVLTRERGEYKVSAGDLSGLTPGSVLAVETPAGDDGNRKLLGHVRVRVTNPFAATVEPCVYEGTALAENLPALSTCRVVFLDYGLRRFKVAIQASPEQHATVPRLREVLKPLTDPKDGLIELVENPKLAEWLVRPFEGKVELLEASGNRAPFALPGPNSPMLGDSLRHNLERVYRARNLIALASRFEAERFRGGSAIDLEVEVLSHKDDAHLGEVLPTPPGGWTFRPGNLISFRVINKSRTPVDVTLLVVGSDFEITPFYPGTDDVAKSLEPGQPLSTPPPWGKVSKDPPFGPECLVVLAAPASSPPIDFGALAQRGLPLARGADASQSLRSPLGELLESAMFRTRTRDGLSPSMAQRYGMRILTWRTEPK
jgi:Caspase domain